MAKSKPPERKDLLWPTLKALKSLGGSASIREIVDYIASDLKLSDEVLDIPRKGGDPRSEVEYRAAWVRTIMKKAGVITNTERGIWVITPEGRRIQSEERIRERMQGQLYKPRKPDQVQDQQNGYAVVNGKNGVDERHEEIPDEQAWMQDLLKMICELDPTAFEHLCRRILLESGFTQVQVRGRSGDGGIDGVGVLRINLLSFHVAFQCKRFTDHPVTARDMRDFRGALVGRSDKGLFITTGRFTRDAEREAVRDGAPAIDLIDGVTLCNLMKELNLGVEAIGNYRVKPEFFENI